MDFPPLLSEFFFQPQVPILYSVSGKEHVFHFSEEAPVIGLWIFVHKESQVCTDLFLSGVGVKCMFSPICSSFCRSFFLLVFLMLPSFFLRLWSMGIYIVSSCRTDRISFLLPIPSSVSPCLTSSFSSRTNMVRVLFSSNSWRLSPCLQHAVMFFHTLPLISSNPRSKSSCLEEIIRDLKYD